MRYRNGWHCFSDTLKKEGVANNSYVQYNSVMIVNNTVIMF